MEFDDSSARAGAVASGVVFGRAGDVSVADQQAFLDSGLWHLLAASGQNIALVAGCCVLLARAVGAGRTTGAALALAAIPVYVLVVGGGASIVRAGVMGVLVLVAWLSGRLSDPWHLLAVSAAAICWLWPGAHRGLGMQLSYACVAALVAGAVPLTTWLRDHGVPKLLAEAGAATALCALATAPVLQLRTGGAPLAGSVANLVAIPIAAALLVSGLAASVSVLAAGPVLPAFAGDLLLAPAGLLARLLLGVATRAAAMPAAQSSSPLVNVGVPALVALWLVARRRVRRPRRLAIFVAASAAACVVVGIAAPDVRVRAATTPIGPDTARIAVLDIGQGDATLVSHGDHAILVDVGPPNGRVVERVRELGIDRIDGVVLTHDSLDHRGGFEHVLASLDPQWVARPHLAPGPWKRIEQVAPKLIDLCAGGRFAVGDVRIDVLHPRCDGQIVQRTGDRHNDGAMVLLLTHGRVRAVLPADAEAPVLVGLGLPPLDLLRISHHGSSDPRLADLLARTRPAVAAISAGEGNDYGHPHPQVLAELRRAGVLTRRTDRDGTIELRSDGARLSIVE